MNATLTFGLCPVLTAGAGPLKFNQEHDALIMCFIHLALVTGGRGARGEVREKLEVEFISHDKR